MGPEKNGNQRACARDPRLLAALASGELTGAEEAECRRHLADCPACREQLARLDTALSALRRMPEPVSPARAVDRVLLEVQSLPIPGRSWWLVRSRGLSIGAVASVLVGLVIIVAVSQQKAPVPGVGALTSGEGARAVHPAGPPGAEGMRGTRADVVAEEPRALTGGVAEPVESGAGASAGGWPEGTAGAGDSQDRGLPSVRPGSRAGGTTGPGPAREAAPPKPPPEDVRASDAAGAGQSGSAALEAPASGHDLVAAEPKALPQVPVVPQPVDVRTEAPGPAGGTIAVVDSTEEREARGGGGAQRERGPAGPAGGAAPTTAATPRARTLASPLAVSEALGQAAWTVSDEFWQIRVDVPAALVERTLASLGLTIRGRAALTGVRAQVVDERGKGLGDAVHIAALVPDRPVDASLPVTPGKAGEQVMGVVVEAEDPAWRTDVAIKVRVERRESDPPERLVAVVLREVPLREAAMTIAVQARIEAEVPNDLAGLIVDADFSEPIPARAALQALADQVGATLVETERGFTFSKGEADDAD